MRCSAATLPVPDVKVCFAAAALLLNVLGALAGVRIVHVVDVLGWLRPPPSLQFFGL